MGKNGLIGTLTRLHLLRFKRYTHASEERFGGSVERIALQLLFEISVIRFFGGAFGDKLARLSSK